MNQANSRIVREALKYIQETYRFMLGIGYEVFSAEAVDLGWRVLLRKSDLFVEILRTRGEEYVSFRAGVQLPDEFVDIGSVVYAATGEKIPISEGSYSELLQKHLDRIEIYFEGKYVEDENSLRIAQEEYYESLPAPEVIAPEEPQIIPGLHYPLMGIIGLLLFGALMTLYMVLLDRLFSAFQADADSYGIFMGTISLLLALGTMLLFWRRRKKS